MHFLHFPFSFLLLSALSSTISAATHPRRQTNTTLSPCAEVSASAAAAWATSNVQPTITAQLGYDCLTSVPLNASAATALVEAILPYVEWQTTTSYLKAPPSSYLMPPVDLSAEFANILTNITAGVYANEHEFQVDLFRVFGLAHDGHFRFMPDLLGKVMVFERPVGLVSVSLDGAVLPQVYTTQDIQNFNLNGGNASVPSAVAKISGGNATAWLEDLSMWGQNQDPDALWNNLFYSLSFNAQSGGGYNGYFAGSGRYGVIYPGANTSIAYENGTEVVYGNFATVIGNFSGVVDGESAYEKFCTGPHLQPYTGGSYPFPTAPSLPPTATVPAYGYPTPKIISSDDQVSGYFLDEEGGTGYEDVAVLSMLSFEANFPVEFQSVVQTFISDAQAAGKTKMVIDLSGNGGGIILTGYDAFRQFFPNIVQDGFSRFREHEAFDVLSEQVSLYSEGFDAATASNEQIFAYESVPDWHHDLNETDGNFLSYEDKFAPQTWNGDSFTDILRWNLSDPLTTTSTTWGIGEEITGYMDRTNFTQPFAAEDIVMIYDGYCASTCTLFSEFMRLQAGVKSIAFGGRPTTDIIQAIGGVKGANNYPYNYIETLVGVPLGNATPDQLANWTSLTAYTDLPDNRSTDNSLNVRDHILRPNLEDGTPAQFVYEAADCRVFYEPRMISDVSAIWRRAADVAWGGKKCVAGSLPSNETMTVRRRKSEEMKVRVRSEKKRTIDKRWLRSIEEMMGPRSPIHGQKVPL